LIEKSAHERFHVTTNPEGGHGEWEKVSSELVCPLISLRNDANRFLVPFYFLLRHESVAFLGIPGLPLEDSLEKGMIVGDSLANERGDEMGKRKEK
jgi:hypothetical protein